VDQKKKVAGVIWDIMRSSLVATGTTARTLVSRCSNWNNAASNSNNNIGSRFACVDTPFLLNIG
jgi:hypothetical protein